ncbi:MAG TPA: hypothetical protein VG873_02465 [Burkholderiales bacterium]|nr:hypothetical protein [Burkholderiales bacterium]
MKPMLHIAALLAGLIAAGSVHARSPEPLVEHPQVSVVTGSGKIPDADAFKKAVVGAVAANQRKWRLEHSADGKSMQAKLSWQNDKHSIVVNIVPAGQTYAVRYVSSVNMKYEVVNGQPVIHPFYNKYVDELLTSIRGELIKL